MLASCLLLVAGKEGRRDWRDNRIEASTSGRLAATAPLREASTNGQVDPCNSSLCTCINAQFMPIPSSKFTLPWTTLAHKGLAPHLMPRHQGSKMPRNIKLQVDPMKSFMRAEGDWCKTVSELSSAHLIGPASYSLGSSYFVSVFQSSSQSLCCSRRRHTNIRRMMWRRPKACLPR